MQEKSQTCKVYLTSWQKRMFEDFVDDDVKKRFDIPRDRPIVIIITKPPKPGCLASYRVSPYGMRKNDWVLYLDDAQIAQVHHELQLETGVEVNEINVSNEQIDSGLVSFA